MTTRTVATWPRIQAVTRRTAPARSSSTAPHGPSRPHTPRQPAPPSSRSSPKPPPRSTGPCASPPPARRGPGRSSSTPTAPSKLMRTPRPHPSAAPGAGRPRPWTTQRPPPPAHPRQRRRPRILPPQAALHHGCGRRPKPRAPRPGESYASPSWPGALARQGRAPGQPRSAPPRPRTDFAHGMPSPERPQVCSVGRGPTEHTDRCGGVRPATDCRDPGQACVGADCPCPRARCPPSP